MLFESYNLGTLQALAGLLLKAKREGMSIDTMIYELNDHIDKRSAAATESREASPRQPGKYRPDNMVHCSVCGLMALIVPLNINPATKVPGGYTHAVQCQNRPATDQPWQDKHCGHTEYIVRGGDNGIVDPS